MVDFCGSAQSTNPPRGFAPSAPTQAGDANITANANTTTAATTPFGAQVQGVGPSTLDTQAFAAIASSIVHRHPPAVDRVRASRPHTSSTPPSLSLSAARLICPFAVWCLGTSCTSARQRPPRHTGWPVNHTLLIKMEPKSGFEMCFVYILLPAPVGARGPDQTTFRIQYHAINPHFDL